jgi:hypothetical protein
LLYIDSILVLACFQVFVSISADGRLPNSIK